MIDEKEIRKAISVLKPNNQLFECRVIYNNRATYSGYFKGADELLKGMEGIRDFADCNFYITLNELNSACYGRSQRGRFEKNAKATTSDNDVIGYQWLMVDLDPRRPTGTSSDEKQIEEAKAKGNKLYAFMKNLGFEEPVMGFSGNGAHLLYAVNLNNSEGNRMLLKKSLETLNMLFADDVIDVDMKNFNPSRVCKLYGTTAQKGSNIPERPHRMSYLVRVPEEIKPTDISYLKKLCDIAPKEEKPQKYNNYQPREFDLEEWLSKYGLRYRKTSYSDGTKYILDCCPFDSNHKGKDACIFQSRSGAIGFHCFHNSCADKTWRDVRILYEPDAYEKRQQEYERKIYSKPKPEPVKIEPKEGKPVFYSAKDILNLPKEDERFIKTGIADVDRKVRGLKSGYTSVLSGLRASAKSTVLSQICCECIEANKGVGVYSGELSARNFMRWMNLQAAGKNHVEPTQFEGYYNVSRKNQEKIADWMEGKFWLYNNDYGNNYRAVIKEFEDRIVKNKLDLLILDNLMAFDIKELADTKYDAQTEFVMSLHNLARKYNVHILFVAHPRKALGFLRLDDISGTGDLANAVDNAFIIHRVNNDFRRLSKMTFGWKDDEPIYSATNAIEIAKDRDGGTQDYFVPLYYEPESKRLKNHKAENKIYSWCKDDGFEQIAQEEIPFEVDGL